MQDIKTEPPYESNDVVMINDNNNNNNDNNNDNSNNNSNNNTNGCNTIRNSNGCQGGASRKGIVTL